MPIIRSRTPDLSQEQQDAVEHLLRSHKQVQTLGGYAGTGKTTMAGIVDSANNDLESTEYDSSVHSLFPR
jgi:hypothetical protein